MRIENGVPLYDNNHERMIALAALVHEIFPSPVGFMLIVHDFQNDAAPISIDNFDVTEDAMRLVRSVLHNYTEAQAQTFVTRDDGSIQDVGPRPLRNENNTDE